RRRGGGDQPKVGRTHGSEDSFIKGQGTKESAATRRGREGGGRPRRTGEARGNAGLNSSAPLYPPQAPWTTRKQRNVRSGASAESGRAWRVPPGPGSLARPLLARGVVWPSFPGNLAILPPPGASPGSTATYGDVFCAAGQLSQVISPFT